MDTLRKYYCSSCGLEMVRFQKKNSKRYDSDTGKLITNYVKCPRLPWYNFALWHMHSEHMDYSAMR